MGEVEDSRLKTDFANGKESPMGARHLAVTHQIDIDAVSADLGNGGALNRLVGSRYQVMASICSSLRLPGTMVIGTGKRPAIFCTI